MTNENDKNKKKGLIIGGAVLAAALILLLLSGCGNGPKISTKAKDSATGNNVGRVGENVTIIDTVNYKGLEVGAEYTITGTLMDKATGEVVRDASGKEITAEKTFTADKKDGTTTLTFELDSSLLAGTTVVPFDRLYDQGEEVAVYTGIDDEEQIHFPELWTTVNDKKTTEKETGSDEMDSVKQDASDNEN